MSADRKFIQIPTSFLVDHIEVGSEGGPHTAPVGLYGKDGAVLVGEGQPYSALALSVHEALWVQETDLERLQKQVEGNPVARVELLRANAVYVAGNLLESPTRENIQKGSKVISGFVHALMKDPKAYTALSRLSSHDPYTVRHSVGTGVNAIIAGRKLGMTDPRELEELGNAGLLHDVGKVNVKREIINKPGPLDELEWEEMRGHAEAGYAIVRDNPDLTDRVKLAVYEHHEDKNGKGYPLGKRLEQVGLFSRIVGVCDIFNALTTERSYSKALPPFEAFRLMREKMPHKTDDEVFRALVLAYGEKL